MPAVLFVLLLLVVFPCLGSAQEPPDILILEPEYEAAKARYEATFQAMEAMERRQTQALEEVRAAIAADDETRQDRAYAQLLQLSGERRLLQQRLNEQARELRVARNELLGAYRARIDELLTQVDSAQDETEREDLGAILTEMDNRRRELLEEEEPDTNLEPMRDITIRRTDSPADIITKAEALEYRAEQYETRIEEIDRRVEELRQDQRRVRGVSDFLSDMGRFGDNRPPVGPPGTQTTPPPDPEPTGVTPDSAAVAVRPMTLEERIGSLETLRGELEERIQQILNKATAFRRIAGGGNPV